MRSSSSIRPDGTPPRSKITGQMIINTPTVMNVIPGISSIAPDRGYSIMPLQVSAIGHIGIGAPCAILLSSGPRSCPSAKAASTKAVGYLAQDGAFPSRLEAIVNQTSAFECPGSFFGGQASRGAHPGSLSRGGSPHPSGSARHRGTARALRVRAVDTGQCSRNANATGSW